MAKINDIGSWREEINQAEKFREDEFGTIEQDKRTLAGTNIDYYEQGFSKDSHIIAVVRSHMVTTLNIIDSIVSIIVPSLYFRNPRTITLPKKIEAETVAPLVGKIIDHFRKQQEAEITNQKIIFDAYVFGYGVYKVGYATKFGRDLPDPEKEKERKKQTNIVEKGLEAIGLKKRKEEEVIRPEMDLRIIAENPFIEYVSPFDFGIDPRATSINDAMFVYQKFKKTVKSLKENKKYKNTAHLKGNLPQVTSLDFNNITETQQESFETRDLFEIHYRNDDKMYMLVMSTHDGDEFEEHYHEESIYNLGEWQFGMLSFKKHGHLLYPRSDITKIKNLQDRLTKSIDSILEQVDKFVPKLAYQESDVTKEGQNALKNGGVGALVKCTKNPEEIFKELNFTQLKADLAQLIDQVITLISVQTGITRTQLTGISDSGTATEAQLEQGGQNIRLSDMTQQVQKMVNEQSRKFWKVIKQFTPLDELELINGIKGIDQETGLPKYSWLTLQGNELDTIQRGEFDFDIEVGSTEKVNLAVVRKAFENLFNIIARSDVIVMMQQQGDKVALAEVLRKYIDLFPELGIDAGKIIQKITQETQGLIPPEVETRGGTTTGSSNNALESQLASATPSQPQILSEAGQI
jgi:hypothetical protein